MMCKTNRPSGFKNQWCQKTRILLFRSRGFSLIEILVTITILTFLGIATSTILTRSFSGNSKTELIGNIKQNGQAALATMEKDIRNSDAIACPLTSGSSTVLALLTKTDGKYIRLTFIPENLNKNGVIYREELFFSSSPDSITLCGAPGSSPVALTDDSSKSAVSVKSGSTFTITKNPGFKDSVGISFSIGPAVNSGSGFTNNVGGTSNSYNFQTTVELR